jgi:hypothetical protein
MDRPEAIRTPYKYRGQKFTTNTSCPFQDNPPEGISVTCFSDQISWDGLDPAKVSSPGDRSLTGRFEDILVQENPTLLGNRDYHEVLYRLLKTGVYFRPRSLNLIPSMGGSIRRVRDTGTLSRETDNNKIIIQVRHDDLELNSIQWLKIGFRYFTLTFCFICTFHIFSKESYKLNVSSYRYV